MNHFTTRWIFGVLLIISAAAQGNDASFGGDGATVFALKEKRIRMVKETIVISRLADKSAWKADCEFVFENTTNQKVTVKMGFPDWFLNWGEEPSMWALKDFTAVVDGQSVKTTHAEVKKGLPDQKRLEYNGAYTWPVVFAPKAKINVKNTYVFTGFSSMGPFDGCMNARDSKIAKDLFWKNSKQKPNGWDFENCSCSVISYIVTTGRTWGGSIGEADIKIQLDEEYLPHTVVVYPQPTRVSNGWIQWQFKNWKPESDLTVMFLRPAPPDSATDKTPLFDTTEQARAWLKYAQKNNFDKPLIAKVREVMPKEAKDIRDILQE